MLFRVMAVGCGTVDSRLHWTGATRLLDLCIIWRFLPSTDNVEMLFLCFHYVILDETARRTTGSAEELKLCLSEDLTALVSARQVGKTESPTTTTTSEIDGAGSWTGCQNTDTTIDCSVIMSANGTGSGPPHWFRNTWASR